MGILDSYTYRKELPAAAKVGRSSKTALQIAQEKLTTEIDHQLALLADPSYTIKKVIKKRGGGTETKTRAPRSWVTVPKDSTTAYITPRYSNKPMNTGGKRGSIIEIPKDDAAKFLNDLKKWAASDESTAVLEKAIKDAKKIAKKTANT